MPDAGAAPTFDAGAAYATALPLSGKSVGHTSVVFKLKLEGGVDVAYKPRSKKGKRRYRGEVAAYRLAHALGIDNVPYAAIRVFDRAALERAVGREAIFADVVAESDGTVRGALVPWIKGLELATVDQPWQIGQWRAALRAGGAVPEDQRAILAQIATVLTFDYVTGNWDRWSGGQLGIDHAKNELLFLDNDGAFFDPVPAKEMRRGADFFQGVDRFSRSFVTALRAVDVKSVFGVEVQGEPLLSARVVAQTEKRRKAALAIIDAKIARLGQDAVLFFD